MQSHTIIPPRLLSPDALAQYFGLKRAELNKMMPDLQKQFGFPNPLAQFGLYDRKLIDLWLDHVSGITNDGRYSFHPPERHQLGGPYAPIRATAPLPRAKRSSNPYTVADAMQDYIAWFRPIADRPPA